MTEPQTAEPKQRFGLNLRRARARARLSQEELGFRCGLHRTEISLLERGGREPRLTTIVKLAAALGLEPNDLCAGIGWSKAGDFRSSRSETRSSQDSAGRRLS